MPQPSGFEAPESWQPIAYAVGVVGAILIAVGGYVRKILDRAPSKPDATQVAVVGGALADRAAMERLAESIDEQTEMLSQITTLLKQHMEQLEPITASERSTPFIGGWTNSASCCSR